MNRTRLGNLILFTCLALCILFIQSSESVSAEAISLVVREPDIARQEENTPPTRSWVLYTRNEGDAMFRVGPNSPPLGSGSLEFLTPTSSDKVTLFNFDHLQTSLSSITALGYSTYRTAGELQQVAALNLQVDVNGSEPGGFTTLVFEPVYNTGQGSVISGQWQTWDAYDGGNAVWWSSNPIPSAPNRDTFVTWSTIVTANPNAVIIGGYGVNQGSGNPALTTATDALIIGYGGDTITYNFEPLQEATDKDACKAGGWKYFQRADQSLFKNQGDCVSYVNTGN